MKATGSVPWMLLFLSTLTGLSATPAFALDAGDAAPSFSAPSLSGPGDLSLAQFRGKIVFVDIWASWCGPCLKSLPHLDELRKSYPSAKFQVLAVNVDRDPEKARAFRKKRPVGYPSVSDPEGRIPERFGLETMPTSYLIDDRGVVRFVNEGFRTGDIGKLQANIETLLGGAR
jgi:thiol-disulfide isomerase/thioredoxin